MSDGVIQLNMTAGRRTVQVTKFRGSGFTGGSHDLKLSDRALIRYSFKQQKSN
jgi:hypothetical protein